MDGAQVCTNFTGDVLKACNMLESAFKAQGEAISATNDDADTFFILWASALVFMMHLGFAMLSAGSVRVKSTTNILMCIVLDACMCCIAWWLAGWAFAYGKSSGGFIGTTYFVGIGFEEDWTAHDWFFQFAFAATAATIVSGAVAERASFEAYLSYSFYLSFWVYPVVVHWVWGGGWLTLGNGLLGVGALDFAGCGPVHMIGGLAGAIGSKIIGPRVGRFDENGVPREMPGHSTVLSTLGVFILWVGWFGFNPGSALAITGNGQVAGRAAINTILASSSGGIIGMAVNTWLNPGRQWNIISSLNGILAGLVSITAACSVVELWAAVIIGGLGGILYIFASRFTLMVLKIDDPLDATPVHLFCGMWGLIVVGFFAKPEYVQQVGGFDEITPAMKGIFYGGNGALLGCNVIEILVIFGWVTVWIFPYFKLLAVMNWLRISAEDEEKGLDESSHGGTAYPHLQEFMNMNPPESQNNEGNGLKQQVPEQAGEAQSSPIPQQINLEGKTSTKQVHQA